jgi:hypothetical protein
MRAALRNGLALLRTRRLLRLGAIALLCGLSIGWLAGERAEPSAQRQPGRARHIALQRDGMTSLLQTMDAQPQLFPQQRLESLRMLSPGQRDQLLEAAAEDGDEHDDALSFQLRRAAFLAAYRFAMDFIERIERDPGLDKILDEPLPAVGLPADAYTRLKFHYLNVARAAEYAAIEARARVQDAPLPAPLAAGARSDTAAILHRGRGSGPKMTARNAAQVVRKVAHDARMPAQEKVARWMGEVRVYRWGEALISEEQIREMRDKLEPGDILLERREWYLTNAGIPGYWPHAALYVGTPETREAFFQDPEVEAWLAEQGATSLEELLRSRAPDAYTASGRLEMGHPRRVLEAIADGVVFTSLEHSAAADSVAVLRPRLGKRARAIALLRAFQFAGRPYDYDFDFLTDTALVCSELVYKAYQPSEQAPGLELPLSPVAGRLMMTPNDIAQRFAAELGTAKQQLDLVLMLDGDERTDRAVPAAAHVFAESWRRPKWHIVTAGPAATLAH